jgi:hypothetical protein
MRHVSEHGPQCGEMRRYNSCFQEGDPGLRRELFPLLPTSPTFHPHSRAYLLRSKSEAKTPGNNEKPFFTVACIMQ